MKKPRIQSAFNGLTPQEIDQIAEWLRNDTYDVVLARVRRPRAEGGYDLDISRSPLARLHGKTNVVRKINERLATGEQLTVSALDAINASEAPAPEVVHDAIMNATHELATSGDNTPSELRTLQTLADFPTRAELRAERHEIHLAREERAQAKEVRAAEMHTQKITLNLRKEERAAAKAERDQELHTQKIQNNSDRIGIAFARYELAKQSLAFRQQQHQDRLTLQREKLSSQRVAADVRRLTSTSTSNPNTDTPGDHLGPYASNREELSERARIHFGVPKDEWDRRLTRNRELFEKLYNDDGTLKDPSVTLETLCSPSEHRVVAYADHDSQMNSNQP